MVDFLAVKLSKVEAQSKSEGVFRNMNVNLNINKFEKSQDKRAKVDFSYTADFTPDVGSLSFEGYVLLGGENKEIDSSIIYWKAKKIMPQEISEGLANLINYTCQLNGVLVAKALNMPAPLIPPRITLGSSQVVSAKPATNPTKTIKSIKKK